MVVQRQALEGHVWRISIGPQKLDLHVTLARRPMGMEEEEEGLFI